MGKIIKDIKVVRPEDKLIILVEGRTKNEEMSRIVRIAEDFMAMKEMRVLCFVDTLRPYIVRKGAKVSLASIFETMLAKGEKK